MRFYIPTCLLLLSSISISAQDQPDLMERPDLTGEIYTTPVNKSLAPRVFKGYRDMRRSNVTPYFLTRR